MRDRYDVMELVALQEEASKRGLSTFRNQNQLKSDLRRSDVKRKWQALTVGVSLCLSFLAMFFLIFFFGLPSDFVRWGVVIAIALSIFLRLLAFIRF